ncbi:Uncharacterised protein [Mycobacteroides abscessus subsp. abscessus]|nr:Uncharacterised protein [Mycobacteroides abscessus subsp. abscessus]
MRLVDDDDLIVAQELVPRELGEEDAVGHHLDAGLVGDLRREADLIADRAAEVFAEFVGDALSDGACGDPPRLRVADHPLDAETKLEADLRQLRRLARTGLTGDDDDLVVADRLGDLILGRTDGQFRRVGDGDGVGRAGLAQAGAALTVLSAGATPSAAALLRPAAAWSTSALSLLRVPRFGVSCVLLGPCRVLFCHVISQLSGRPPRSNRGTEAPSEPLVACGVGGERRGGWAFSDEIGYRCRQSQLHRGESASMSCWMPRMRKSRAVMPRAMFVCHLFAHCLGTRLPLSSPRRVRARKGMNSAPSTP